MKNPHSEKKTDTSFPVVGIGASAGGLDAFKQFLQALPATTGMAFVFVQHLSRSHSSLLPEILEKVSPLPVSRITDNVHLEKDHLYIIPENKMVTAVDGVLKLADLNSHNKHNNTIDLFFSSLGSVHQSYAVGVVLSGLLNDGSLGLQVIKSYGGITFAQDAESSGFDSMPTNAAKTGVVDFVLPPDQIARHLVSINRPFNPDGKASKTANTDEDNDVFKQILTVLRVRRGVDFQYYKSSTLKRRIQRRMALNKVEKPSDYLYRLRENKGEQDALYNDMLISVTNFFREPKSFHTLCNQIFPSLIRAKTENETLRIWIAGCATGEEAYSMAISLQELLGDRASAMKIQIFATDISENAITKARTGIYQGNELEGLSISRLQQFFTKRDGSYQVNKIIRDMCVFAHHNFLKDPPFSRIDVVSCRNVLIYLEPVLQKRALTTFHYALNANGFLMLGKSETIGNNTDIFTAYKPGDKLYQRKGPAGRFMNVTTAHMEQGLRDTDHGLPARDENGKDVYKISDDLMLANFMPPGVLVNEKFDIVQFKGITDTWLSAAPGKPSFNILKQAREGLAFELRNLLHQAKKTNLPVKKYGVFFKANNLQYFVNLHIFPVPDAIEAHFLVVFQAAATNGATAGTFGPEQAAEQKFFNAAEFRIEQLERELIQARADMRVIAEEQESANEELQSANEELLSGSEELQSLNEELETSKEELQSTNEEIIIVNKELLDRNEQLNNSRLYTEGIVNTIRDALVVMDKALRVKRATEGFYRHFKLNAENTEGYSFFELNNGQWDIPGLRKLLEGDLPKKKVSADVEIKRSFPGIGERVLCLNARLLDHNQEEASILLSIEDITDRRMVEQGLAEVEKLLAISTERLSAAVESAEMGTWDYDAQHAQLTLDERCAELTGLPEGRTVSLDQFLALVHPEDREMVKNMIGPEFWQYKTDRVKIEYRTADGTTPYLWLKATGKVYLDTASRPTRIIGTLMDITGQKLVTEATLELVRKKDEFISIASHELKTPITTLNAALQLIERASIGKEEYKHFHIFVQKATEQVRKLIELVKTLLDVTRIQSGKLELSKTQFSLHQLISSCISNINDYSKSHEFRLSGGKGREIFADKDRLEQVINNLLTNAAKYSPKNPLINIRISTSGGFIKVAIADQGIGIESSKLPHVFDRFFRVEQSSRNFAGLGLGLYISSEIVKQHGGQIGVESELGKGSTFWFSLPVGKDN